MQRWDDNQNLAQYGVGYLLWGLLDVVVDGHFDTVQQLDDKIDGLEDLLFDPAQTSMAVQRQYLRAAQVAGADPAGRAARPPGRSSTR